MRFNLRTLLISVTLVGSIIGLGGRAVVEFFRTARFGHHHVVKMTFDQLPTDDFAMWEWVHQSGMKNAYVHRVENTNTVIVGWIESRRIFEPPPIDPDVASAFAQRGCKTKAAKSAPAISN